MVVTRHISGKAWQVTDDYSDDVYICEQVQRNVLKKTIELCVVDLGKGRAVCLTAKEV